MLEASAIRGERSDCILSIRMRSDTYLHTRDAEGGRLAVLET